MKAAGFLSAWRTRYSRPPASFNAPRIISLRLALNLLGTPLGRPCPLVRDLAINRRSLRLLHRAAMGLGQPVTRLF
jgi:hypothetical protein